MFIRILTNIEKLHILQNIILYQSNLPKNQHSKIQDNAIISYKKIYVKCLKWTFSHNYRVATLFTLNLTVIGIIIPNKRKELTVTYRCTGGLTLLIEKLGF